MKKKSDSEKDDNTVSSCPDINAFDEEFSTYLNGSGDYSLSIKTRRKIEDLLDDKKLKDEFDDFMEF
jgi:hypothetical protein